MSWGYRIEDTWRPDLPRRGHDVVTADGADQALSFACRSGGGRVVLAGGSGALGTALADDLTARGMEAVILTRHAARKARHRLVAWDGRSLGPWAIELDGCSGLVNLAGRLVDARPTQRNIAELSRASWDCAARPRRSWCSTVSGSRPPSGSGDEGSGFRVAMSALDTGRIAVASGCVGLAQGCLEASLTYAGQREQFGKPIASHQLVQELLADMAVDIDAARFLVWRAADLVRRGEPFGTEASVAKLFATEASVRVANQAVQVFGGYGYIDEFPVGKALRDSRVTTLYEGTSQIQKLLIGRAITGINAF